VFRLVIQSLILIFSCGNFIYSQSCDLILKGEITDLHDNSLLIGAVVSIQGTNFFSQTDLVGAYKIKGLCPGKYNLVISHPECITINKKLNLKQSRVYNLELEHHINELDEIIVTDSKVSKLRKSIQEVSLNISDINSYGSNTLVEALNYIPGASILKTGNSIGKPIIHGMYGSRVGIVTDDFRQYDQQWGPDHAPNIDFDSFDIIQLIKGAAALKYGGDTSAGSIILSSKRKKLKDTLFGKSSINIESNGRGGKFSSRLEKNYSNGFYINGNFTGKRYGDFNTPDYILSNSGFKEANFSIKLGKDLINKGWNLKYSNYNLEPGILKSSHIGNVQDLFYALNSNEPSIINDFTYNIEAPKQIAKHQKLTLRYFKSFENNTKLELGYNFQNNKRKEFDIRRGGRTGIPVVDLLLKTHTLNGSLSGIDIKNWNFELGLNGFFQDNFSTPDTGVKRLIPDYIKFETGIYFLGNFQKSNAFLWEWGLRLDHVSYDSKKYYYKSVWNERNYNILFKGFETGQDFANQILTNPKFNYLNVSAQTGASLNISNELKFKMSYILSQRAPNPSELFSDGLHHAIAAIEYGSLSLEPETSHKFLFSFSKNNKNYNWSLEPYISKTFGYIFIEPTGLKQTIRGAFPVWTYDSTDAFMTGIDINSSININRRLMFDVGASYTYAEDILNKEPIILIPPLNTFQKLKFTPLKGNWSLEFTHQTSAKQNRFPNSNFIFDYIEDGELVSETVDISSSPRGFQKLDAIFSILIGNKNNIRSNLRLIIQNITNSDYRDYLNRMRFYSSEIGRNFQIQLNFNY
jgi:iron complex outermembrane receptor protein